MKMSTNTFPADNTHEMFELHFFFLKKLGFIIFFFGGGGGVQTRHTFVDNKWLNMVDTLNMNILHVMNGQ